MKRAGVCGGLRGSHFFFRGIPYCKNSRSRGVPSFPVDDYSYVLHGMTGSPCPGMIHTGTIRHTRVRRKTLKQQLSLSVNPVFSGRPVDALQNPGPVSLVGLRLLDKQSKPLEFRCAQSAFCFVRQHRVVYHSVPPDCRGMGNCLGFPATAFTPSCSLLVLWVVLTVYCFAPIPLDF